jgi:hypothetical protein
MSKDPIVAEVRRVREAMFRRCDYDLKELGRYLEARRKQTRLKTVRRNTKRTRPP